MATFRVVCYASSPEVFQIVPICGGLVGGVWGFAISVVGLREVHRTTTGKAAAAVLLPGLLCCGMILIATFSCGLLAHFAD
jgi:hypothetical protein